MAAAAARRSRFIVIRRRLLFVIEKPGRTAAWELPRVSLVAGTELDRKRAFFPSLY